MVNLKSNEITLTGKKKKRKVKLLITHSDSSA
jgi:hypothetical protein